MRLRHFREADLENINPREEFKADPSMDEWLVLASQGWTYTITADDDRPIMILGCNILWEGVAQVWTVPTEEIRGSGLYVVKITKFLLRGIALKARVRRFHCIIHTGYPENIKWIELLGFQHEGTMFRATPDKKDLLVYVKWFEQYLEDHHVGRTEESKTRLQRDVEKLLGLDAGRGRPIEARTVQRTG